ncbi:MAG: hypothetical protein AAGI03_17370 [Pseudomonadota bacterium]
MIGLALGLSSSVSAACEPDGPVSLDNLPRAQAVFVGAFFTYRPNADFSEAKIAYSPLETVYGEEQSRVVAKWQPSLGSVPFEFHANAPMIMAITQEDLGRFGAGRLSAMRELMLDPCDAPLILADTPENRARVWAALGDSKL